MKSIIELAREVNNGKVREWTECHLFYPDELERFAALVRAAALEEVADMVNACDRRATPKGIAAAIRALKEKT